MSFKDNIRGPGFDSPSLHKISDVSTMSDILSFMKTIEITCANCNSLFDKALNEYNRQIKNGKNRFFCGRACLRLKLNEEFPPKGNINNLVVKTVDQYSDFRWFISRIKTRNKNNEVGYICNLSLDFLKKLWESQNGKCPFTNNQLLLPNMSLGFKTRDPFNASLDRINNSKGYIEGNVRFISVMANYARNNFSDEQLIDFCKKVTSNND